MTDHDTGPIRFLPAPSDVATRRLLAEKLRGHASAANWLPEGLTSELDRLRAAHLETRDRVIAAGDAVAALEERHRAEDTDYEKALRQAHRDPQAPPVEDRRTPPEQREAEHVKARESYWAAVWVLGERVDAIHSYFRDHEADELLAELRDRRTPLEEYQREARRVLREADVALWGLAQLGQWIQRVSDGVPQPAPVPSTPPPMFNEQMLDRALERPWHKRHPEELPVSWQEQSEQDVLPPVVDDQPEPPEDPDGDGDPTGVVSALEPEVAS
jgi:hypothetical protein